MKWIDAGLGVLFGALLWWRVDVSIPYQLCEWEQEGLFLTDWRALGEVLAVLGGFGDWLSGWGMQFFAVPHWGAGVFVLPVVGAVQLLSQYDFYYQWTGSVCLLLVMALLSFFAWLPDGRVKALCFAGSIPVVFYLLGSVVTVYAVGGMVWFFSRRNWGLPAGFFSGVLL